MKIYNLKLALIFVMLVMPLNLLAEETKQEAQSPASIQNADKTNSGIEPSEKPASHEAPVTVTNSTEQKKEELPQEIKMEDRQITFKGEKQKEVKPEVASDVKNDAEIEKSKQSSVNSSPIEQSKNEYLKKIQPVVGSYTSRIEPISPDGNMYLLPLWPRSRNGLDPYISKIKPNQILQSIPVQKNKENPYQTFIENYAKDDGPLGTLKLNPSLAEMNIYRDLYKSLIQDKVEDNSDVLLLRANLGMILIFNGFKNYYQQTFQDYSSFVRKNQASSYYLDAVYNIGYIFIKSGKFLECIQLANKEEDKWLNSKQWTDNFRSLIMESYYNRNRYIKTEDFLWMLATRIEKSELTQHLALRYSDALFWENKYLSMIEWQKNEFVAKYFDNSKPWIQVSGLYLAEAFFQIGKYDEALNRFQSFKDVYKGKYSKDMLDFRILQCQMMISGDFKKYVPVFYNFALKLSPNIIQDAARVQWARLIARETLDGEAIISEAHAILTGMLTQIEDLQLIKETVLVKSFLNYRLGEYRKAVDTLAKIYPRRFIKTLDEPFLLSVANYAVYLLERVAPEMWEQKQTVDFLVLADRFTYAIQFATNKSSLLFWVGRAYVENGMTGSAVRIFEKLLKDINSPNRTRTAIELAKAYGLMGNTDAMGRALSLVQNIPDAADEKALYFLTKATYQMATKNYAGCAEDMDQLLIRGVQGDELFRYALEGAICARKAKQYDRASKLLILLDTENENLLDSSLPKELEDLHQKGLFEKVNILSETQKYEQAVQTFQKIKSSDEMNTVEPPLETVFLVIDALRKTDKSDDALKVWKDYAEKTKSLPKGFGDQFTRLLELLASTELVPEVGNQAEEGATIKQ